MLTSHIVHDSLRLITTQTSMRSHYPSHSLTVPVPAEATRPGRVGWTKPRPHLFVTTGKEIALRGQCLSLLKSSAALALTESNFSKVLISHH